MKLILSNIRYILIIFASLLCGPYLWGQVQITTHVLPPYQSRIADYASHPELMLVTLTNLSTTEVNVQLTAKITGDNGIAAWVKPGYRSPSPITIQAGQSISLHGNDIAFLFDINKIEYTGISRTDMTRGVGLLEGNYTLCIRALRYSNLEPISPDQPLGCTSFRISDVEPPRILSPFADQVLDTKAVQAFPITWSTPPGSPPGTQYKVRIVEMVAPRNPNDLIQSTPPLIEETVFQNMLLYGPSYPALVPGRKYALVVQAQDPEGKTFFRNRGISEVLVFTYGKEGDSETITTDNNKKTSSEENLPKKYATNTIKGRLVWAFKRSEEVHKPAVALPYKGDTGNMHPGVVGNTLQTSLLASHYLEHNPIQANNATALAQTDPTLDGRKMIGETRAAPTLSVEASSVMSANGASSLALTYENVTPQAGQERHALAHAKITLRGVKSIIKNNNIGSANTQSNNPKPSKTTVEQDNLWAGLRTEGSLKNIATPMGNAAVSGGNVASDAQASNRVNPGNTIITDAGSNTVPQLKGGDFNQVNILATGRTDLEGNFEIHFMDPKYAGNNSYERIILTVETSDFETFEHSIPIQELSSSPTIELGEKLLLAKTYRLNPTYQIEPHNGEGLGNPGVRVRLLRPKEEVTKNTYLQHERADKNRDRQEVILGGRTYIVIAKDSIEASDQRKDRYNFSFAGLFYSGELRLEFEPLNKVLKNKSSGFRVIDQKLSPSQILVARPTFVGALVQPAVSGQVILKAGENMVPVADAVLTVSFREEDKISISSSLVTVGSLNQVLTSQINKASTLLNSSGGSLAGTIPGTKLTQLGTNINMLASASAIDGTSQPVYVAAGNTLANSSVVADITYQQLITGDQYASEEALRKKYGQYTVKTDSTGQYYIGNLPLLKEGASYTVKLASVPASFKNLEVSPGMEQQFIAGKGIMETRSFTISPEIFNIVGRVVDQEKKGIPFARAHFKGSTNYFETGEQGLFQTSYYRGNHTLIVEKEGYLPLEIKVNLVEIASVTNPDKLGLKDKIVQVAVVKPGQEVMNMQTVDNWTQSVQNTHTVKNALNLGATFSPAMFGNAAGNIGNPLNQSTLQGIGNTRGPGNYEEDLSVLTEQLQLNNSFQAQINKTYKSNAFVFSGTETTDLGDIGPMLPRLGKVKFTVVYKQSGAPVADALISLFDSLQYTDIDGIWLYEGFGGRATVTVKGPQGSGLVPIQRSIQIDETGKVTDIRIELERGVKVYGIVRSGTFVLDNAYIAVEGRDYLNTKTDASGRYELYMPIGEYTMRASKSGYFAKREARQLQQQQDLQLDFMLEDGGGRNISSLLGFEIELDKAESDGAGERWTGRFVNMKGVAPLFDKDIAIAIPFTDARVSFDRQGNAIPQNNVVLTDLNNITLKAFGFLPVVLKSNQQLKVTGNEQGKGTITGRVEIDISKIQGSRGYTLPSSQPILLTLNDAVGTPQIDVFKANANSVQNVHLKLAKADGADLTASLYGFTMKLDLSRSSVSMEGIELAGEIKTPALGPISAANIQVEQFKLSKDLKIQVVKVQQQNLPSFQIGSWKAQLTALLFNESGFKVGGRLKFTIPQSSESTIDFTNLKIGKDAIYGGDFNFPTNGISIYKIAQLTTGSQPLGFGRVGNTQVYYLAGSANMKFGTLFTKEIKIPSFQFQTDGRFLLEAPVNQTADLAFAKFKLASLTLSTLSGQKPYISVQGEFSAEFPGLRFEASDIRFSVNTGGQVGFSVGTIKGELSVAVLKAGVTVGLYEDGFKGGGKLGIPGTPINAEIGFHYRKVSGGIDIGAEFAAGVSIPIGIVEITQVGGGFSYNSANKKFMVNIKGGATISGMRALVELKPISLTVESGPIITGHVGVVVGTTFKLVDAYTVLNFRDKFFAITVNSDIEPIKGVARARLNGLLKIKWDPQENYVFLGANMDVDILKILKNYGEFALGVNIKNPKSRGDEIASYFKYLEGELYNGNSAFSGVYLHSSTSFGVPKDRAVGIGGDVFGVRAWFYTGSDAVLVLNFAENDYRFRLAGTVEAGGEGCFIGICVGGGFSTCYALMGGYSTANGWQLGGRAGGNIEIQIGKRANCNSVEFCAWLIPCGGRVCIGAHAALDISTKRGLQFSVGMGNSNTGNLCR
ncbi:peptidase associated/transthyretin-like domain-containing protein [Sphingobacterium faecale]|uniref:TANFOR domain-containing protein n=1 Tax=Sphingobacterium faecale TaxID=2803775 RepID=A0ABS1R4F4_9SPHI|nr:hypothetical protein [Sphingobacterium faecale]MBL1409165.1 hypothetical protein [Sphingobacterium faecale]